MRLIELTDLYRPRSAAWSARRLAVRGARQPRSRVRVVTSAIPGAPAVERSAGVTVHRLALLYQRLTPRLSLDAARPFHPPAPDPLFRRLLAEVVEEVSRTSPMPTRGASSPAWPGPSRNARDDDRPRLRSGVARRSLVHRSGTLCPGPSWRRCGPCASSQYGLAKGNVLAAASLSSLRLLKRVTTFTAVSGYVANRLSPIIGQVAGQQVHTLHSFVPDGLYASGWQAERPEFLPAEDGYLLYVGSYRGIRAWTSSSRPIDDSHPPPPLVMLERHTRLSPLLSPSRLASRCGPASRTGASSLPWSGLPAWWSRRCGPSRSR